MRYMLERQVHREIRGLSTEITQKNLCHTIALLPTNSITNSPVRWLHDPAE